MKTHAILSLLLSLALIFSAQAQLDRSKKPTAGPAPKAALPEYSETVLSNGLKVIVISNASQPLVTFRLMFRSGSEYDGGKTGIAEFTADLLTKGTKKRSSLQFAQDADMLGVTITAAAADDNMFVTGSGLKKHMQSILDLMADAVNNPTFPAEELEKSRTQTLSGLSTIKKDPDAISNRLNITVGFNAHPYSKFQTEKTVQSITRDDLVSFHRSYYIPNNASLAIIGDVTAKDVLPIVKKFFGSWKQGSPPKSAFPIPAPVKDSKVHLVDLGTTQTQTALSVLTGGMKRNDPDWIPFSVANSIFGGGFSGRLFQNLREKHGFTYGAYSSMDGRKDAGMWATNTSVRRAATDSAAFQIIREMQRMVDETVPEEELSMHKQYLSGRFLLSLESPAMTASYVQNTDLYNLPKDYYTTYASRLSAVTAEDVKRVSKKFLTAENLAVTAVGDASAIMDPLKRFGPIQLYDADINPLDASTIMKVDIDAETLIAKHLEAIGGAAKVASVKDRTMEGEMSMKFGPQSLDGSFIEIAKIPNKKYQKTTMVFQNSMMEQEEWNDGVSINRTQPMGGGEQSLSGQELEQELDKSQFNEFVRWKDLGYKAEVKAKKQFDGKPCYVLELKRKLGSSTYYFDASTYFLSAEETLRRTEMGEQAIIMRYFDYKPVDGIQLAHRMKVDIGPMSMEMGVKSYKQNTNVQDDIFQKKK